MADGLISRVQRLVSGGLNDLVDSFENAAPESVMREAIREIDRAIDDVRDRLGVVVANRHHASKRLMDANTKHEDLGARAQFAVGEGRDDLAEAALARQLDIEAQIPILEVAMKAAAAEQSDLEEYVVALTARKREMEADLATFLQSRNATSSDGAIDQANGTIAVELATEKRADKAESAFNRIFEGTAGVAATARADRVTASKLAELEKVAREHRVQERLAALKAVGGRD
ncbi:MAG: PspA/IM30 family protein [Pseudomonadota bacterium]